MDIYLYGAGRNGKKINTFLLEQPHLGEVKGFIDSNPKWKGGKFCGLPVYMPDEMKINKNMLILLTPDLMVSLKIADSLKQKEIYRYLYWDYLEESGIEEKLSSLTDEDDVAIFNESLMFENRILKYQVSYLMDHIDATAMKQASGEEREFQIKLVKLTADLLKETKDWGIDFILCGGNLLGYYRHNGFIPWDDDMDLILTETDFYKFQSYCRLKFPYYEYDGEYNNSVIQPWYKKMTELHKDEIIILETPLLFRVYRNDSFIDIFPFRRYRNDIVYQEHDTFCKDFSQSLLDCKTCVEQKQIVEDILQRDMKYVSEDGENWTYSPHSVEGYFSGRKSWYKDGDLFPTKKVFFEGVEVSVPNNIEGYLKAEYGANYMSLPSDLGLYCHRNAVEKF